MDYPGLAALIVAITAGLAQVIVAVATLVRLLRCEAKVEGVGRGLNGRLDLLLLERERRMQAEHAVEMEKIRTSALSGLTRIDRPEGKIVTRQLEGESGTGPSPKAE